MGTCAGGTWQAGHNASREKDRAKGQGVTAFLKPFLDWLSVVSTC